MELFIDNKSGAPIYDQIYSQIKDQIIQGALQPDEAMPSIRGLARDLRISVITTKRAYDELEKEGFLKARYAYYLCIGLLASYMGYFVSSGDSALESILPAQGSLLVLVVVLAAVLALYALSWRLSVAWYGKAEQ